jgi:hypothetical protein
MDSMYVAGILQPAMHPQLMAICDPWYPSTAGWPHRHHHHRCSIDGQTQSPSLHGEEVEGLVEMLGKTLL